MVTKKRILTREELNAKLKDEKEALEKDGFRNIRTRVIDITPTWKNLEQVIEEMRAVNERLREQIRGLEKEIDQLNGY